MTSQPTFIDEFSRAVTLDPATTALVVVDMQNATGNRNMGLGKLLAEAGKADSSAYRFDRIETVLIPNISRLLECFRAVGASVIYITYGARVPDASDVTSHIRGIVSATRNIEGHAEHDIVAELSPRAGEPVLNKTTMGAFRSTALDTLLRARGIQSVVTVGVSTNNCVAMTAMEAADLDYGVVVVSDGTGTDSEAMQNATLESLRRLWSRVMTTDEVIAELQAS
ncbi:MAG: isochorismatase family protein [Xanthomonadales bacterium]|nr:isochorismatase family protein [Xanthomonadales bacterium]NIN58379.1 isochorismatase family protein [Xanthomonadales bacterium]NIN73716.1 isochorismatase family protein [Xanthomonadales bacterium]NIO14511.1 isochorismatase family protein [Xanthomonadales bacterium]NIP10772.1 isochorismatase family protein [Xanthomonadales bacterium]